MKTCLATVAITLLCAAAGPAEAAYIFVDPTGFGSQTSSAQGTYGFAGYGSVTVDVDFQGSGISFATSSINSEGAGLANPAWMGGLQPMFRIVYAGSASGGPKELAELQFTFSTPLSTASYMLFTDFDSYESVAIAAFDNLNALIPFADLTTTRVDGQQPGGASNPMPVWSDTNPTQGWATTDNTGWVGTAAVSGFLQDTSFVSTDDTGIAIQSARPISRVVLYANMESISGTGNNSFRFNFASPVPTSVPEPSAVVLLGLGLLGACGLRRKAGATGQSVPW